jgi:hypothetical protein
MIDAAKAQCKEQGISQMYVHVVPSNEAALKLYLANGFFIEVEERADAAYLRDRERRLLLRFDVKDAKVVAPKPAAPEPAAAPASGTWDNYCPPAVPGGGTWSEAPAAAAPTAPAPPAPASAAAPPAAPVVSSFWDTPEPTSPEPAAASTSAAPVSAFWDSPAPTAAPTATEAAAALASSFSSSPAAPFAQEPPVAVAAPVPAAAPKPLAPVAQEQPAAAASPKPAAAPEPSRIVFAAAPTERIVSLCGVIPVEVYPAANMADLHAAAAVRTVSFTVYNKDRSEFSKQSHRKMTMASERNALQRKMNGEEPGYDKVKVTVLLATTPVPEDEAVAAMLQGEIDPSCKLPAKDDQPPLMCLGSLDLNQCETFPSEDLMPLDQSSNGAGRAFLSNVCTTSGGRRSGIASKVRA